MPRTINGCGTWYYGKRNLEQYEGTCQKCGRTTTLASYDTRLYVVFLMIPIFPLGRKRIIEKCSACTSHRAMPFREWEIARHRANETVQQYKAAPANAERAKEALGATLSLRDQSTFLSLAETLERNFAANAEILCFIAAGYESFGRLEDAERNFRAALAAEDDDDISEALALCYLRQGRPEDAEPFLQHIIDQGIPDRVDLLYQLAQCWQAKGDHERAIAVFDQCEAIAPAVADDKTFSTLRDASEQRLGTAEVLQPASVVKKAKRADTYRRVRRLAPLVVALAVIAYTAFAWLQGFYPAVYLANGLNHPYDVSLNGTTYTLQPSRVQKVPLSEGDVSLEIVGLTDDLPPETLSIRSRLLTRPFASTVFVINPDHAAVLRRTRAYYGNGSAPDPEHTLFAGQTLYRFNGIDHAFEPFPESISTTFEFGTASRDGLFLDDYDEELVPAATLMMLTETVGKDVTIEMAKRRLLFEPDAADLLGFLAHLTTPEDLGAFLRPHLEDRPVRMDWHRVYQDAMSKLTRDDEVEQTYTDMLAAEPENAELMYLLARASRDTERAVQLCKRAASAENPTQYAPRWLCSHYLSRGDLDAAADSAEDALALAPDEVGTHAMYRSALIAGKRYERVLELVPLDTDQPFPYCIPAFSDEAYVRSILGQDDEPGVVVTRLRRVLKAFGDKMVAEQVALVTADQRYVRGEIDAFVEMCEESQNAHNRLAAAATKPDLDAAQKALGEWTMPDATAHLLVFLVAHLENAQDIADKHRAAAIKCLSDGDRDDRVFAEALADPASMSLDAIADAHEDPNVKRVYVAAIATLATKDPHALLELAEKLNFDRRFPHRLIQRVIDRYKTP